MAERPKKRSRWDVVRDYHPRDADTLWAWIFGYTGVKLSRKPVCEGHSCQMDAMSAMHFDRPERMLTLGARGSGKSFMTAIDTHLCSRFYPRHGTRIMGGAKSQAKQVLSGFNEAILGGRGPYGTDRDQIAKPGVEKILYKNGSEVEILTASETSVRGPHIPTLRMDEVDEIEPGLQESAYGMVMDKSKGLGPKAMVSMTSTWHNLGGPMAALVEEAHSKNVEKPGSFPFFTFCLFDVLEKCPDSISGENLEYCPACPLMRYCHEDKDRHYGVPKAKRADGHYTIASAIQKINGVSTRVFEADYLCRGPRPDGLWFTEFSDKNVTEDAEYDPSLPVQFALDTGLRTGGVWFQVHQVLNGNQWDIRVSVFADYYAEHLTPEQHLDGFPGGDGKPPIEGIKPKAARLCNGRFDKRWTDPAGNQRNAIGTVALGEWQKAGMSFVCWPATSVKDGLALVENLLHSADGTIRLVIHPRCRHLIQAFQTYRRRQLKGVYMDEPEEPQHPQENLMDALRGGLVGNFPDGRKPAPPLKRHAGYKVF